MRTDMTTEETGAIPVPSSARYTNFEKILTVRCDGLLLLAPGPRSPQHFSAAASIFRDRAEKQRFAIQASATSDAGLVMRG